MAIQMWLLVRSLAEDTRNTVHLFFAFANCGFTFMGRKHVMIALNLLSTSAGDMIV